MTLGLAICLTMPASGPVGLVYAPGPVDPLYVVASWDTVPTSEETIEYLTLHTDKIGPGVWDVSGVSEPDVQWWADDPLGAGGQTTHAFTLTGSVEEIDTPFCNAAGTCIKAKYFDGSNDYYVSDDNNVAFPSDNDFTACAVLKGNNGLSGVFLVADGREGSAGEGWMFYHANTKFAFDVENHAGTMKSIYFDKWDMTSGWSLGCATYDHDGNWTPYANRDTDSLTGVPGGTVAPTGEPFAIGASNTGIVKFPGYIAAVLYWDSLLSTANLNTIFDALQAMSATTGTDATFDRNSTAWAEDASGQYQAFGQDMAAQTGDGVSIHGAVTNYWTDSLDASAWTDSGAPVITTNTTSGPFATYNSGAEADTIDDDAAGSFEGKYVSASSVATTTYTASCWLRAGTNTGYRLAISTDGTGSASEIADDLTSSFVRKEISATVGGAPTYVRAFIQVGDNVADTGTIIVSGCQLEKSSFAGRPCLAGGSAATCAADNGSVSTTGWPTSQGRIELTYTPEVASGFGTIRYFVETLDAAVDYGWYLRITNISGTLIWYSESVAGAGVQHISAGLTWTAGTSYFIESYWYANGVVKVWRTPAGGSRTLVIDSTGADVADQVNTTARIGSYTGTLFPAMGSISGLKVSK